MKRQSGAGALAALALTCVFGATLLLSLAAGAGVYRRVADRVERSAADRVSLSYITAKIHGSDAAGQVEAGSFGDGDALFLCQEYDGIAYETILYVYNGQLMEMLCERGWEQDTEFGEAVCPIRSLKVGLTAPGLLRLTLTDLDGGTQTADVFVRSEG